MSDESMELLRQQCAELEAELMEKDANITTAAMLGKQLMESNNRSQDLIDDMRKQHCATLEEKQQEVSVLQSRLETASCTERWLHEEVNTLRSEVQTLRTTVTEELQEKHRRELNSYKKQIADVTADLESQHAVEQELRERVSELETLLESHLDRTQIQSLSITGGASEELAALSEQILSLQMDLTEQQAKNIELNGHLQQALREKDTATHRLTAELEETKMELSLYARHLDESKRENLELQAQLDALQMEPEDHCPKGNSLFSELEDRRMVVEKKFASLKVQYQQLKEKYDIDRHQANQYKTQLAMALMATSKDDGSTQHLRQVKTALNEAHKQIENLMEQIHKLQSSKDRAPTQVPSEMTEGGGGGDRNFIEYLKATIESERSRLTKLESELQGKRMQYLDASKTIATLTLEKKDLETERNKLQYQLVKVKMEKDEILLKYEPEKVKNSKQVKTVVEKIDLVGKPAVTERTEAVRAGSRLSMGPSVADKSRTTLSQLQSASKARSAQDGSRRQTHASGDSSRQKSDVGDVENVDNPPTKSSKSTTSSVRTDSVFSSSDVTFSEKENLHPPPTPGANDYALPRRRQVKISEDVDVFGESKMSEDGVEDLDASAAAEGKEGASLGKGKGKDGKGGRAREQPKYIYAKDCPKLDMECKQQ